MKNTMHTPTHSAAAFPQSTPSPSGGGLGWGSRVFGLLLLLVCTPTWAATSTLTPTADAYVQAGKNAAKNFGTATTLITGTSATTNNNYDSYLKFDTTSVPNLTTVKLRLYAALNTTGSIISTAYPVPVTTWGETTLNWNNKPARGAALGNLTVASTTYAWYEIDVTTYVRNEYNAGRKIVSFAYHNSANSAPLITAHSKEGVNKPQLIITYNVAPTVSVTAPAASSVVSASANITITATAADSDGVSKVDFYADNILLGTSTATPYTYVWANATAGAHQITAKATDNLGATTTSTAVAITVNTPPTVSLTAPTANAIYTAPATLTLSANATDSDGISKVEFYNGNTLLGTATTAPYSITWNNVAAGTYQLTAQATDNLGIVTVSSAVNISVAVAPALYYIETDHLDTPRQLSNASGTVVWKWDSTDAFGANLPNEDPDGDGTATVFNLRMPGQYADKEMGSFYNYFRDYDSTIGRYISSDPIGLSGGVNTYGYVLGNPIGLVDSLGLWPNCVSAILSTSSNTYDEINKTILAQALLPVPMPAGVGVGPNEPGKLPIGPEINWDMWEVRYTLSQNDTYRVMQVIQHLLVTCSETRTGECGKTENYNYSYEMDNRLDPLKTIIDSQLDYNYEKIRKLFSFSTGF